MKIKHIVYLLLIIGIGSFIGYRITTNQNKNGEFKGKESKNNSIPVTAVIVKSEEFDNTITLSGSIEANEQVEIRSEISGLVEGIYFKEGSTVNKGQLLFKVNDTELRAQLTQAKTKQELASENERRAKLLLQKEAISQEEYDVARAEFKMAQAQVQLIQAQITKTAVKAPFSGKIGLRAISPGTFITPNLLVTRLVNISTLKITFSIPEKYANQIKPNSSISFTVAGSVQKYQAKVYAIEPEVQVATRTLQVRAVAENKDGKLLPGTFANVTLPLENIKDAIVIPTEAVIPVQDGKKVFIANNGKAKEVKIETSNRTSATVLVLSGLKEGDTVLTSGVMSLKEETPIEVKIK